MKNMREEPGFPVYPDIIEPGPSAELGNGGNRRNKIIRAVAAVAIAAGLYAASVKLMLDNPSDHPASPTTSEPVTTTSELPFITRP